jgi:hypothetical protein
VCVCVERERYICLRERDTFERERDACVCGDTVTGLAVCDKKKEMEGQNDKGSLLWRGVGGRGGLSHRFSPNVTYVVWCGGVYAARPNTLPF